MKVSKLVYQFDKDTYKAYFSKTKPEIVVITKWFSYSPRKLTELLNNNYKLVVDDFCPVYLEDLYQIYTGLESKDYFNNLHISKHAYITSWYHKDIAFVLKQYEILDKVDITHIVESDKNLNASIQFKDLFDSNLLLKRLDSCLFIKKKFLSSILGEVEYDFKKEYSRLLYLRDFIKANLVDNINAFLENLAYESKYTCFVNDETSLVNLKSQNIERIGLFNCFNLQNALNFPKAIKDHVWLEIPKIKQQIDKKNIDHVVLLNIQQYEELEEIKVCVKYASNSFVTDQYNKLRFDELHPLFLKFDGWKTNLDDYVEEHNDLPKEFNYFLGEMKRLLNVKHLKVKTNNFEFSA